MPGLNILRRLRARFRPLTRRHQFEEGLSEELRFHMEQFSDDLIARGVAPEDAARLARIEFGSVHNAKGDCREARGLNLLDELSRELRYAVRLLRKTPGFTITALATLAICLGANLTIFSVVDAIVLRSLPLPAADRLILLSNSYPGAGADRAGTSIANYFDRRGAIKAFASISIYNESSAIIGDAGSP